MFFFLSGQDTSLSSSGPIQKENIKYRTNFGSCPSRSAGQMTLKMIRIFEETGSLRSVKEKIIKNSLDERHFVSDYKISFDPLKKMLFFNLDCPKPLMKVQIYKDNGIDSYEAILVDSGELFDPTYEVLLRTEKKLENQLPYLAIPVGELEAKTQKEITRVVDSLGDTFRRKISEVILDDKGDLTVILSLRGNPSSVFMGPNDWYAKADQLKKIVKYMESNKKIPAIINLTNSKKVVVKFNSNL
ncbi:MAG: cell division protein FtsQ/DivIB [Bacteriovoracaceae bacterium]|nr:cell division protein FtsQ/DivIB [Bacteriovoracaceae bacterium]